MGERTEALAVREEARRASEKIRSIATGGARRLYFRVGNEKSHPRNQKRFHSRYNFGYGILLYIRKMPTFSPLTAHFGGFEGVFSYKTDKAAILCPDKA